MNNLKNLRLQRNLTQNKLCEELKTAGLFIDRTTYSKYETGSREMSAGILIKFSEFFDVSIDYIIKN